MTIRRIAMNIGLVVVLSMAAGTGWFTARAVDPRQTTSATETLARQLGQAAGQSFLDEYVQPDGQVVRRDEGGDTVSEGQAYGMLIAAAIGDQVRFRSVWSWTRTHLRRPDGLLSWRWVMGAVVDANSASDADLDAARALLVAGRRFHDPALTAEGRKLGSAILSGDTVAVGTAMQPPGAPPPPPGWGVAGMGRVLTAGSWVKNPPFMSNPGYFSPRAERDFATASADPRWDDLTRTQRIISWQLIGSGLLPPDWATVDIVGGAVASGPADGGNIQYGLDAARFPVRMAESCDPADRALAGELRPVLAKASDAPAVRNLDGTITGAWQHPIAMVALAATDAATGDTDAASRHLDAAASVQQKYPTYYGAAWVALGRIMLLTDLLGECPKES